MKARIFFICYCLPLLLWAQGEVNRHELSYSTQEHRLKGHSRLSLPSSANSILLHWPLAAFTQRGSYLQEQLLDFQDIDLYYATKDQQGSFIIDSIFLNGQKLKTELKQELTPLPKRNSKGVCQVDIYYQLDLPSAEFIGNGYNDYGVHLIDLLPRLEHQHSAQPLNFFYDQQHEEAEFFIKLQLPADQELVSNLSAVRVDTVNGARLWQLNGKARTLQMHWSEKIQALRLPEGTVLYTLNVPSNIEALLASGLDVSQRFFQTEIGLDSPTEKILILPEKKGEYQSEGLLTLAYQNKAFDLQKSLVQAQAEQLFRYRLKMQGWQSPWLSRGLPYYYKYHFIRSRFPQERWVPFSESWLGQLVALDKFDYAYQNQFLWLFLARQGLDQSLSTPADSLSRLNYEAVAQAKSFLAFSHLRAYIGDANFRRSMARFYKAFSPSKAPTDQLEAAFHYFSPKQVDWFFDSLVPSADYYDYQLLDLDRCPTLSVVKVRNNGDLAVPYSVTGYRNGTPVLTEWFPGHLGVKNVSIYHERYDKVVINAHLANGEFNQKNNRYYNRWLFPRAEPLSFQFYNSFEKADRSQVFYMPVASYNAYDKLLIGGLFTNASILVQKPWEYRFSPNYSTGTGQLTGSASLRYVHIPQKQSFFRQISAGLYGRYYHYDQDLAFARLSPALNLRIRKDYPKSPVIQRLRLRGVFVSRERPSRPEDFNNIASRLPNYQLANLSYRREHTDLLRPSILKADLEVAGQFSKLYGEWDQRWMLPNKKWLILRGFGGLFLHRDLSADQNLNTRYFDFGLGGTTDYLFDQYFIGRSDQNGLWSQQIFITDGGFRSPTSVFASRYMVAGNASLPLIYFLGLYGDAALADDQFYWTYGIRLAFLTDFLELYLPLQDQGQRFYSQANYLRQVRFVLDLDLGNIMNRLRRGFY